MRIIKAGQKTRDNIQRVPECENDVNSYKQIKDDLDGLRLLVEKSELWVYKSKSVEEKVNPNSNKGSKSSMSKPTSGKKYIYFKEIGT